MFNKRTSHASARRVQRHRPWQQHREQATEDTAPAPDRVPAVAYRRPSAEPETDNDGADVQRPRRRDRARDSGLSALLGSYI